MEIKCEQDRKIIGYRSSTCLWIFGIGSKKLFLFEGKGVRESAFSEYDFANLSVYTPIYKGDKITIRF